jgi:hypothetical protein
MLALYLGANPMHDAGANHIAAAQARRHGLEEVVTPVDRERTGGGEDAVQLVIS